MRDDDYWKEQYKATWGQSAQREINIAKILEQESGKKIIPVGLGAGSTDYFSGSAATHGHVKGDADLQVVDTNIYLEVTGPLVMFVDEYQELWIRPDKLANAKVRGIEHEIWVIHHLPKKDLIRVIPIDTEFWNALDRGSFPIVTPSIRGAIERYHAIPANHRCVKAFSVLVERLKNL